MVTITNNNEILHITIKDAQILFEGSHLYNLSDIKLNINNNEWEILKSFIEKEPKIQLHNNDLLLIIKNNVMEHLRINIIPRHDIIMNLGLYNIYEQLIFYKYIYSSSNISLCKKLEIILENNYVNIIAMIENNILDICIDSISDEIDYINTLYSYYYDNIIFEKFINLHTDWLPYDMKYFKNTNETILINELYYLTKINIIEASTYINNLESKIVFNFNTSNNKYTLLCEYKVYDMFIHMIERNILMYSDKTKKKNIIKMDEN